MRRYDLWPRCNRITLPISNPNLDADSEPTPLAAPIVLVLVSASGSHTGQLGTITRSDGSLQVTYKGLPFYFFHTNTKSGDTKRNYTGWSLVSPSGGHFKTAGRHPWRCRMTDRSRRAHASFELGR